MRMTASDICWYFLGRLQSCYFSEQLRSIVSTKNVIELNFLLLPFLVHLTLREKCRYSEFFWSIFFRIWTDAQRYSESLRIQSECMKIRTRKTPNADIFRAMSFYCLNIYQNIISCSVLLLFVRNICCILLLIMKCTITKIKFNLHLANILKSALRNKKDKRYCRF